MLNSGPGYIKQVTLPLIFSVLTSTSSKTTTEHKYNA